jgi:hypothetical protein
MTVAAPARQLTVVRGVVVRGNPDWSPWVLLLIPPIVLPLITPLYNRATPELFGMPAFYWMQLAFVPLSALCTGIVYLKTRKKGARHE